MKRPMNRLSCISMRFSHLTLATPYQSGTIRRSGKPFAAGKAAPFMS